MLMMHFSTNCGSLMLMYISDIKTKYTTIAQFGRITRLAEVSDRNERWTVAIVKSRGVRLLCNSKG